MTRVTRNAWPPLVIPACCFLTGVVVTLLWTSSGHKDSLPAPHSAAAPPTGARDHADAFDAVAEALTTSIPLSKSNITASSAHLSRHDLLLAIPSSLARSTSYLCHSSAPQCALDLQSCCRWYKPSCCNASHHTVTSGLVVYTMGVWILQAASCTGKQIMAGGHKSICGCRVKRCC